MNKSMRCTRNILLVMLAAYFCLLAPASADEATIRSAKEDRVKVAFLYNFVKFVEWQGAQSLSQTHTANICILGSNPFGEALAMLKQASTPQLALNIETNVSQDAIAGCHILFINQSSSPRLSSLLAFAESHSILTVSEINGFADEGGIIEMVKTEKNIGLFSKDKINLRINMKQAEAEGLRIDAQLLEIASEVIK